MQIKADEISKIIEDEIQNYDQRVEMSETGTVLYVGDGIARVYGVENAMAMELLEFPGGVMGMVLNLEEDNVGVALLGIGRIVVQRRVEDSEVDVEDLPRLPHRLELMGVERDGAGVG